MKVIKTTYYILSCVFLTWMLLSYLEIIGKNLSSGATYSDYNIIINLVNYYMNINGGIF